MAENNRWWESYLVRYLAGNIFAVFVLFYLVAFQGEKIRERVCPETITSYEYDLTPTLSDFARSYQYVLLPSYGKTESGKPYIFNKQICSVLLCWVDIKTTSNSYPTKSGTTSASKTSEQSSITKPTLKLCKPNNFSSEVFSFIFITTKDIESKNAHTAFKDSDAISNDFYGNHTINVTEINFANIFVLGVFSFLYMYISSMPIYLLHILRAKWLPILRFLFGFRFRIPEFCCTDLKSCCKKLINFINFINLDSVHTHLQSSTKLRSSIKNPKNYSYSPYPYSQEYITSYTHLREHGNAFGIILLEIVFSWLLICFDFSIIFLSVWLLLGFSGWFVGIYLEDKMLQGRRMR